MCPTPATSTRHPKNRYYGWSSHSLACFSMSFLGHTPVTHNWEPTQSMILLVLSTLLFVNIFCFCRWSCSLPHTTRTQANDTTADVKHHSRRCYLFLQTPYSCSTEYLFPSLVPRLCDDVQVLFMGTDIAGARDDGLDVVNLMHGREDVPSMEVSLPMKQKK